MVTPSVARFVVISASIAAVIELVVLRVLTRTAVFIPGISERIGVVNAVGELGRLAYSVSLALVAATLLVLAVLAVRQANAVGRMVAAGLIGFVGVALMARIGWVPRVAVDVMTIAFLVLVASTFRSRRPVVAVAFAAFSVALALAGADAIWRNAAAQAAIPGTPGLLLNLAEWALLGAVLTVIVAYRRTSGGSLVLGAALGGVLLVGLVAASATVRILLLWTVGLPGALPSLAYGAAAFAAGVAIVSSARHARLATAAGVILLAAGGLGLQSTYQSGLVLVGLAALALRHLLDDGVREPQAIGQHRSSPIPA